MHIKIPSTNGCKYAQIFATKEFFADCYPISTKNQADDALMQFIRDYGVPDRIISDGSKEQSGKAFNKICKKYNIDHAVIDPHKPN